MRHRMAFGRCYHTKCLMAPRSPVAFASRTLTNAEKKYSQIEKEGLACIFAVKSFHQYLSRHHFILRTKHKPLLSLFNEVKAVPPLASSRIQRWALTLASYKYTIIGCRSVLHANADAMSCLPLPEKPRHMPVPTELVLMLECMDEALVTAVHIAAWTRQD